MKNRLAARVVRPEGCTPLADNFVGDSDATFCEQVFHVSKAKGESMIEPHGVRDDIRWKMISTISEFLFHTRIVAESALT